MTLPARSQRGQALTEVSGFRSKARFWSALVGPSPARSGPLAMVFLGAVGVPSQSRLRPR